VNSDWIESAINVVRGIEDFSQNISTRKRHPCLTFGFFAGKPVDGCVCLCHAFAVRRAFQ
jgi:hypothetical protein